MEYIEKIQSWDHWLSVRNDILTILTILPWPYCTDSAIAISFNKVNQILCYYKEIVHNDPTNSDRHDWYLAKVNKEYKKLLHIIILKKLQI